MVLVVTKKSGTFFSFPYSANEQMRRSWEGAQSDSWPKLAKGNIPLRRCLVQFINGSWPGVEILFFQDL